MATLTEKVDCGDLHWGIRDNPPSDYLLEIESFSLFSECGYGNIESGEFVAGGHKWKIVFFPNGDDEDYDEYMSIYLSLEDRCKEVHATFRFFLFDQIRGKYLTVEGDARRYDSVKYEWGVYYFISLPEFKDPSNGYLVSDTCVLGAEVYVVQSPVLREHLWITNMVNVIYNYTWKLTHFSELVDDVCFSNAFDIGIYKWRLCLHPKGDLDNRGCSLSLYLELMDSLSNSVAECVKADFTITLKDQINKKHHIGRGIHWFGPTSKSYGWGSFIHLKYLPEGDRGFIVDDCCEFEAQITLLCKTHLKPLGS